MNKQPYFDDSYEARLKRQMSNLRWRLLHIDPVLVLSLLALSIFGLFILYSASDENVRALEFQGLHLGISFLLMLVFAQISPQRYQQWAPYLYSAGVFLLLLVLIAGHVHQGGKRWLEFAGMRLQPTELMKLAMPMMLAWFLSQKILPPSNKTCFYSVIILLLPVILTAKQPDLGTAIIIACSGFSVLLLAGIRWRLIAYLFTGMLLCTPLIWHSMHAYQRNRVLTFLNPESDPLGNGYHIIQSKIAIGSGGVFGKGWLHGTQSHLSFLPEHTTDFIFSVSGEELGLFGAIAIILLFCIIFVRMLYMSSQAQSSFNRLLAGSIAFTFILSAFVNMAMVLGLLPVVGVPLPLISYGGSYMITTFIGFGIIMSIYTHKKLWSS